MILKSPIEITSRLMAGVRVGGATLSIDYLRQDRDGRDVYDVWIDLPDGREERITDLKSGCQGGGLQEGLGSLLSFLGAAAESYRYRMSTGRAGENEELFSPAIVEWAYGCSEEIDGLALEIEESEGLIEE
jgi:hypothetical protein